MKLRKLIAIFSAVMMLCAIIPMGAMSVFAADNLLVNGDFETGDGTGWDVRAGSSITGDVVHGGSYAMQTTNTTVQYQTMANQTVSVTANTDYTVSFWYYYDGSNANPSFYLYILDAAKANVDSLYCTPAKVGTWYQGTLTFNTGSNTTIMVYLKNNTADDGGTYYYDDVVLTAGEPEEPEEPEEPVEPEKPVVENMLTNGDFETGDLTSWQNTWNVEYEMVDGHDSEYAVKFVTADQWNALRQEVDVEPNTDYVLTYDAKDCSNLAILVKGSSDIKSNYPSGSEWKSETLEFNSGDNSVVKIMLMANKAGGTGIIDNVVLYQKDSGEEPEVPVDALFSDDFESGALDMENKWFGLSTGGLSAVSADAAKNSNYGMKMEGSSYTEILTSHAFPIEDGVTYTISFDAKGMTNGHIGFQAKNARGVDAPGTGNNFLQEDVTISTVWKHFTYSFTKGAVSAATGGATPNGFVSLLFVVTDGTDFYLDNVVVTSNKQPDEPEVVTNLIVNPDFETGDGTGWDVRAGSSITGDVVHGGSYAMKTTNTSSQYQTMATQTVTILAHTDYTISFWYYYEGSHETPSFHMYPMDTNAKVNLGELLLSPEAPNTWYQATLTFNSGDYTGTKVYLKNETAGDGGVYYFDDFVMTAGETTLPELPEIPDEPAVNMVLNGDFEDGENYWSFRNGTHEIVTDAHGGSSALKLTDVTMYGEAAVSNAISVTSGSTYVIKWWSKRVAGTGAFNMYIIGDFTSESGQNWMNETSGNWVANEYVIIANANSIQLKLSSETNNAGTILIDDVTMTEVKVPSFDGFLTNGDFEMGSTEGWSTYQDTVISRYAAKDGNYGVQLKGNGGWGGMLKQTFTTKKGFTYVASMDIKVNSNGANIQICDAQTDSRLVTDWMTDATWTTRTFTFVALDTSTYINFCGGGNGIAEDVYIDNIVITEKPCEHQYDGVQDEDCNICGEIREVPLVGILSGGQTSASKDVMGLAFRFEIEATGTIVDVNNKYVSGSARIQPFGADEYQLVHMGAVITNNADSATAATLNLNTVNGKNIVNVEALYPLEVSTNTLAYAVRIVDIPETAVNTNIYARPYYVFEKNGEKMVVYGDIVTENYNAAIG